MRGVSVGAFSSTECHKNILSSSYMDANVFCDFRCLTVILKVLQIIRPPWAWYLDVLAVDNYYFLKKQKLSLGLKKPSWPKPRSSQHLNPPHRRGVTRRRRCRGRVCKEQLILALERLRSG